MANKRNYKEMQQDYLRIKEAAKTATSLETIATMLKLSIRQIKTTLIGYPGEIDCIKEQLKNNRKLAGANETNSTEEISDSHEVVSNKTGCKQDISEKLTTEPSANNDDTPPNSTVSNSTFKNYVIDTSITGIPDILPRLERIMSSDSKIVICNIVLSELDNRQKSHDEPSKSNSRRILSIAAKNPDKFDIVTIDETVGIPDDCIIKYCRDNKHTVILLTADKVMALKAREISNPVETHYIAQDGFVSGCITHNYECTVEPSTIHPKTATPANLHVTSKPIKELPMVTKVDDRLRIENFHSQFTSIRVISHDQVYNEGSYDLQLDDEIMIATLLKDRTIDFKVYKITSFNNTYNCKLIFSKRIYNPKHTDIATVRFNKFIYEFMHKHNIRY